MVGLIGVRICGLVGLMDTRTECFSEMVNQTIIIVMAKGMQTIAIVRRS